MILNLYTIYDRTAEEAGPVFQAVNDGVARRNYRNLGIPADLENEYELRCIGIIDTKACCIIPEIVYTVDTSSEVNNG